MKKIIVNVLLLILVININSFGQKTYPATFVAPLIITGQGNQTALNNNICLAVAGTAGTNLNTIGDIAYNYVSIGIIPAAGTVTGGLVIFEESMDNINYTPLYLINAASSISGLVGTVSLSASTATLNFGQVHGNFFRARISTAVSGTTTGIQAFCTFSRNSTSLTGVVVNQATASGLNVAIGTNANNPQNTSSFLNAAAGTNATVLKASSGNVYLIHLTNITAAAKYFRLFNKSSAPTLGTDIPSFVYIVAPNSHLDIPINDIGMKFTLGISYAITNAIALLDATVVAAGDVQLTINWQ